MDFYFVLKVVWKAKIGWWTKTDHFEESNKIANRTNGILIHE